MKLSITDIPKEINIKDQKMSLEEVLHSINTTSAHKDSKFILFTEAEENYRAKFTWVTENKWKVDYPIRLNDIHKQRYVSLKQCLQVIEIIYQSNDVYKLIGFYDVPIKHFTLDEMIQFKKEDEMMLRGQDPDAGKPSTTTNQTSNKNNTPPTSPKSKKTPSKPLQQIETAAKKEATPNKAKSIAEKTIKKASKSSNDDNSFFSI